MDASTMLKGLLTAAAANLDALDCGSGSVVKVAIDEDVNMEEDAAESRYLLLRQTGRS